MSHKFTTALNYFQLLGDIFSLFVKIKLSIQCAQRGTRGPSTRLKHFLGNTNFLPLSQTYEPWEFGGKAKQKLFTSLPCKSDLKYENNFIVSDAANVHTLTNRTLVKTSMIFVFFLIFSVVFLNLYLWLPFVTNMTACIIMLKVQSTVERWKTLGHFAVIKILLVVLCFWGKRKGSGDSFKPNQ